MTSSTRWRSVTGSWAHTGQRHCKVPTVPEVRGGLECTVNRIGDRFHDRIARSGHADRLDDIDRGSQTGVRPEYSALGTARGQQRADCEESLARCVATWQAQRS